MQRADAVLDDRETEREEVLALTALDEGPALLELDTYASDRPPCIDDYDDYDDGYMEAVPPAVNYPAWSKENSFVVSGPLGDFNFPGRRFTTTVEAEKWMREKYGFIYETRHIPGRWIGVVPKPSQGAK